MLSTVGVAAQGVLRLATTVLIASLASPAVVGVIGPVIAAASFLSLLWPTAAGNAASKYIARARGAQDWDEAAGIASFIGRRSLVVALALAGIGLLWGLRADVVTGLCVAALVLGYSGYAFVRGVQFGGGQLARATAWDVLSAVLALIMLAVLLVVGVRGTALVLPLAGAYLLYTVAGWPRKSAHRLQPALRREVDHFVLLGVSLTVASSGFLQLTQVVAKEVDTEAKVGYYTAALALATPASLLAGALSLVLFPTMAEAWGRQDFVGFRRQTDRGMRLMVLVLTAVFGALVLLSGLLVGIFFKPRFAPATELLPVLLLATFATSLAVVPSNSLATRSRRGMALASGASVAGLVTGLLVWATTAEAGGVRAVAVGYLCGTVVLASIPTVAVLVLDRHRWHWLLARLAVAVAVLLVLRHVQDAADLARWTEVPLALAFIAGWFLLCHRDVRALLVPLLRRG